MNRISRRRFLRALSAGGAAYAFGRTPGTVWAQSSSLNGFSDYKALVCVYLTGGNDSWSMVVPRSAAEHAVYAQSRRNLAIAQDALLPVSVLESGDDAEYGIHPSMPGVHALFESARCAVIANVGTLIEPVTKEQYAQGGRSIPPQLFSHNDQQRQWLTLRGRSQLRTGWAGRVADALAGNLASQQLATNVSLSGNTVFHAGEIATPYIMGPTGATEFTGLGTASAILQRRLAFERIAASDYGDIYGRGFADVQRRTVLFAQMVNDALEAAPPLATAFPPSPLAVQLKTVARMIAVRDRLDMSRQIFYVGVGGFDTHDDHVTEQPGLLGDLSASLAAFHAASVELGVAQRVTTFTYSEFGRSLTSNGDGSDHGWGGVQLVIGDAVAGRAIYGQYPLLQIGSDLDVGGGRMIPTTSTHQYAATLARWFGVDDAQMSIVAPNLQNFSPRYLEFLPA